MSTATLDPAAEQAKLRVMRERLEADPVERIRTLNGFQPWSKQREIIEALYEHRRVAVQSCHGVGKTAVAAAIVEDFMRLGPCRIVTTAPTNHQVETLLWGEIRKRARMARIPWQKKPSNKRWTIREDWAAFGFSTNEPERFSGHHGRRLLFVVDEASGVDEQIYNAARGFLTGDDSYVLMIGNPTQMVGTFFKNCQPTATRWKQIKMSAYDTPVYQTSEKIDPELLKALPQRDWVEEMKEDWGEDSPEFRVRVLGEFAPVMGRLYYPSKHISRIEPLEPRREGYLSGKVKADEHGDGHVSFTEEKGGPLRIWSVPDKRRKYLIFADVAGQVREDDYVKREDAKKIGASILGGGDDFCAAVVLDLETGEQVAEYRSQEDPDEYGRTLARIGHVYAGADGRRGALLGVESNNMGQAALSELKNAGYRNMFRRTRRENARQTKAPAMGLVTTRDSRERILAFLASTLREKPGRVKSALLKYELERFVKNELGFGSAAAGFHDDLVISMAGALEMRDQVLRRPGSDEEKAA